MIDSHCHLADETFAGDLPDVVARARDAGLERALVILEGGNEGEAERALRLEQLWPEVRVSIGVHPHQAHQFSGNAHGAAELVRAQFLRTPAARAIGEIGLDYHYDFSPRDVQQEVFRAQLQVARDLQQPVVIHTREADDDTLSILREAGNPVAGVLHCFTGSTALATSGMALGLHVSFAGILTFPKAASLRETARQVPLDRVLVETDSPFLAPVPYRGKRNEPAYVARVLAALADVHGVDALELARRTTANFHSLFRP
jgi:TatD DNase family protein